MKCRELSAFFTVLLSLVCCDAQVTPSIAEAVTVTIEQPRQEEAAFHWQIHNSLPTGIYIYDFYLWGPAFEVDKGSEQITVKTAPTSSVHSCPPNRFPPVLLLAIAPGRTIEGDFVDSSLKGLRGKRVVLQISAGMEAASVRKKAERYFNSGCQHNPYDAVYEWGTLVSSEPVVLNR